MNNANPFYLIKKRYLVFLLYFLIKSTLLYAQEDSILRDSKQLLEDKSRLFTSNSYQIGSPSNETEVKSIINYCIKNNKRIVFRGSGHSANGSSIPLNGEIVVSSRNFTDIHILNDTMVEVGAGVVMYNLKQYLNERGLDTYVINEGGKGPTLGGFISAGGVESDNSIGFWETVLSVSLINGKSEEMLIDSKNELFPWLFGSMGQLGFITKAVLKIKKGEQSLQHNDEENVLMMNDYKYYWFPFFIATDKKMEIENAIESSRHAIISDCHFTQNSKLEFNKGGIKVNFIKFIPPLLFQSQKDMYVLGFQLFLHKNEPFFTTKLDDVRANIDTFIKKNGLKSYFQVSYYQQNKKNIVKYLGKKTYKKFMGIKLKLDPMNIFGSNLY